MTSSVHNPTIADDATAVSALTLAFSSDPAVRWMYPESHRYLTYFPAFARALGEAFKHRTAYTIPSATAAALWLPPGVEPDEEAIGAVLQQSVSEEQRGDLFSMFAQMGHAHPTKPHWYLPLIGVDPAQQRKGLGSTLLQSALAMCDRDRQPAYLEATSAENIPLYERHGFQVVGKIQAGASPIIFPMLRAPK